MNLLSLFCLLSLVFAAEQQLIQESKTEICDEALKDDFRIFFENACQEGDELSFRRLYDLLVARPLELNGEHFRWALNLFPLKLFQAVTAQIAESAMAQVSLYEIFNLLICYPKIPDRIGKLRSLEERSWDTKPLTSSNFNGLFMTIQQADLPEIIPILFKYNEGALIHFEQILYCLEQGDRLPAKFIQRWVSEKKLLDRMEANRDYLEFDYLPRAKDAIMLILDNSSVAEQEYILKELVHEPWVIPLLMERCEVHLDTFAEAFVRTNPVQFCQLAEAHPEHMPSLYNALHAMFVKLERVEISNIPAYPLRHKTCILNFRLLASLKYPTRDIAYKLAMMEFQNLQISHMDTGVQLINFLAQHMSLAEFFELMGQDHANANRQPHYIARFLMVLLGSQQDGSPMASLPIELIRMIGVHLFKVLE